MSYVRLNKLKLRIQPNSVDLIVLFLGLLPFLLYVSFPYFAVYFELNSLLWAIAFQVVFFFGIGFPAVTILYFWWRFTGRQNV